MDGGHPEMEQWVFEEMCDMYPGLGLLCVVAPGLGLLTVVAGFIFVGMAVVRRTRRA